MHSSSFRSLYRAPALVRDRDRDWGRDLVQGLLPLSSEEEEARRPLGRRTCKEGTAPVRWSIRPSFSPGGGLLRSGSAGWLTSKKGRYVRLLSRVLDRVRLVALRSEEAVAAAAVLWLLGWRCRRWRRRLEGWGWGWLIRRRGRGRSVNGGRGGRRSVHGRARARTSSWQVPRAGTTTDRTPWSLRWTISVDRPIRHGMRLGRRDRCRRGCGPSPG